MLDTDAPPHEVEVHGATSMGYAALHVAEALGFDPEGSEYALLSFPELQFLDEEALAADYHERKVCLCIRD